MLQEAPHIPMERGKVLSLPMALAANHSSPPPTTFCYGLHLIPVLVPRSLVLNGTWCALVASHQLSWAPLDLLRPESSSNCPSSWPSSSLYGNLWGNKKIFIKQNGMSPTVLVPCIFVQSTQKIDKLFKASLFTTRLVLSHPLLPRAAQGPYGSRAVLVACGVVRVHSPVLSHVTLSPPQLLYCFKAITNNRSEHCGRDQHDVPVGLQDQSLNMYYPIKYSGSKGVYGLSSKLIAHLCESLH